MSDKLTVEMLLEAKKLLDKNELHEYKEYYLPEWKNPEHPYYEICVARVASGLGFWLEEEKPHDPKTT